MSDKNRNQMVKVCKNGYIYVTELRKSDRTVGDLGLA